MNWIDITVYLILGFFIFVGLTRGLVRQVFSVAALVGGIIAGLIFYDVIAEIFLKDNLVNNKSIANVGAFLIVGFISYLLIQFLGWITTKIIGTLQLSWLNRLGGALIGIVIGAIAAFLFISSVTFFVSENDTALKNSTTAPYLNEGYQEVIDKLPQDLRISLIRAKDLIREEGLKAAMRIKDSEKVREILNDKGP
jgi:membrane protein required for colicin V production